MTNNDQPPTILDAGHEGCGTLLVLIFQALRDLAPGEILEVLAYDRGAQVDIPAWCRMTGHTLLDVCGELSNGEPLRYIIRKKEEEHGKTHGEHHSRKG